MIKKITWRNYTIIHTLYLVIIKNCFVYSPRAIYHFADMTTNRTILCLPQEALLSLSDEASLIRDVRMTFYPINAIISFFGIVVNVLNLCVFCRQTTKDSLTVCFIVLAILDLTTVTSLLIWILLGYNEREWWSFEFPGLYYPGKALLFSRHFLESFNKIRIIRTH